MKKLERCEEFAKRLAEVREEHGLKAGQVADLIGVTAPTMSRFENGIRTPDVMQIKRLSEAIPVNLHWLVTGKGIRDFHAADDVPKKPFQVLHEDRATDGWLLVPECKGAIDAYQVKDRFMEPRINENDYVFIDRDNHKAETGDLVAFRDDAFRFRVGWLRKVRGERGRFLVSEMPSDKRYAEKDCIVLGRVVCSVKVDRYR